MASSSTSSGHKSSFKYDVFLSFRGEDTRKTFVGHLYYALQQKSIHTYKDDERIKKGNKISDELIKSIQDSRFHIIVFSKNYASSSWCLEELVKIMECQKMPEQTAYPVFYDVEPTEVRKQSGEFGAVFAKHEKEEAVRKWREALKEAADLAGWELKKTDDGDEAKFIRRIVEEISLELRCINFSIDEKLVGMEARIRDVVSSLEIGHNDVRMIGIKGMGGGGKTTLARVVFDKISTQFEGKSFVENVREVSNGSLSGLKSLQEKILRNVLNDKDITIDSVHDGKNMLKRMMCGRKVLLVLDDVDHTKQLEALAGELNWFNEGSRIIITTRDEQVLVAHRVNLIRDVNLLSREEALCLFSRYAFGREIPIQGYEELSNQVVRYAAGLPLTITVLGSFLWGKIEDEWRSAIQRLKTIPSKDTLDILEISYIGLEDEHKEIFLDVACILKGYKKEDAIRTLESCGFYARIGLRVLEQKSLVTISEYGWLDMHDRIEEMGQDIVRRKLEEPNKHSRLWINEEIKDILVSDQGTNEAVRCIKLITSDLDPKFVMEGLGNMKKLRFLQVAYARYEDCFDRNWKLDEVCEYFPNALQCLRWEYYPFGSLPKSFQANNLVQLEMPCSEIEQLWEGGDRKVLNKLRFLDLSHSKNLKNLDLGLAPNLEILNLQGCSDLVELRMPTKCLKLETLGFIGCVDLVELRMPFECPKLQSIDIRNSKLRTLDLRGTRNLEELSFIDCVDLVELHMPIECPKLKSIDINVSKLRTLDLRGTRNLEELSFIDFVDLVELHMPIDCPKLKSIDINRSKLRTLDLRGTPNLEILSVIDCVDLVELHIPVEALNLKYIDINCSKLRTLDLRGTPNLEGLSVKKCVDLVQLQMPVECLKLQSISIIRYSKLKTLDLRGTPNLERLRVQECADLVELQLLVEALKLKSIDIDGSKLRTLDLRGTPNLERLSVVDCVDLLELHMPVECPKLESIKINGSKLRTLALRGTWNLETLCVEECVDLVELHIPVEALKLKSIYIIGLELRTLDLRGTRNLERLSVVDCVDLVELHMPVECPKLEYIDIGNSKLRTLDLRGTPERLSLVKCVDLVELHMPVECPKLKSIDIDGSKLTTLDLLGTRNLERLSVIDCVDLVELHMPVECPKLESIEINGSNLVEVHVLDGCLKNLDYIDLSDCLRFKSFSFRRQYFESVEVGNVSKLHLIAASVGMCPLHFGNNLPKFQFICLYEEHGPSVIGNLEKLLSFGLCACTNLERFSQSICGLRCLTKLTLQGSIPEAPKDLDQLECLEELHLLSTKITHLPDSICMLKYLKHLELNPCWLLEKLPEDLGRLECLEKLILVECVFLRDIPDNICKLKRLRYFHLKYCVAVEKLPEELGRLTFLEELNIEGTGITQLPQSIFLLKGLRIVAFIRLLELCGFTSEIQSSEHESFCYI